LRPLEDEFLSKPFANLTANLAEKRRAVKAAGLWAPQLPVEYGGLGLRLTEFAQIKRGTGTYSNWTLFVQLSGTGCRHMEVLMMHGNQQQKAQFLLPLEGVRFVVVFR